MTPPESPRRNTPPITTDVIQPALQSYLTKREAQDRNAEDLRLMKEVIASGTRNQIRDTFMFIHNMNLLFSPEDNVRIIKRDVGKRDIYLRDRSFSSYDTKLGMGDTVQLVSGRGPAGPNNPNGYLFQTREGDAGEAKNRDKTYVWVRVQINRRGPWKEGFMATEHLDIEDYARIVRPSPRPTPHPTLRPGPEPERVPTPLPHRETPLGPPAYNPPSPRPFASPYPPTYISRPRITIPRVPPPASRPLERVYVGDAIRTNMEARVNTVNANLNFERDFPLNQIKPIGANYEVVRTTRIGIVDGTYSVVVRDTTSGKYAILRGTGAQFVGNISVAYLSGLTFNIDINHPAFEKEKKALARTDICNFVEKMGDKRLPGSSDRRVLRDMRMDEITSIQTAFATGTPVERRLIDLCNTAMTTLNLSVDDKKKSFLTFFVENILGSQDFRSVKTTATLGEGHRGTEALPTILEKAKTSIDITALIDLLNAGRGTRGLNDAVKFLSKNNPSGPGSIELSLEGLSRIRPTEAHLEMTALNRLAGEYGGWTMQDIDDNFELLHSANALQDIMKNPHITWTSPELVTQIINSFKGTFASDPVPPSNSFLNLWIDGSNIDPETKGIYIDSEGYLPIKSCKVGGVDFSSATPGTIRHTLDGYYYQGGKFIKKTR